MFEKEKLASRIHHLRVEKQLNQDELGNVMGVTKGAVSKIEKAKRAASIEALYALADYFDVSIDYLVGRSDDPRRH
ncbi:helix-turn-helix domain-containing protein [Paenibacillus popilliae]|uniref:Predicted transcriptional regulator n=1 Tax=Paenibacillus popilliae ATCC 14706 TaxID=1212764 RepID=M9LCW9_PAEPP|nr:helix-turn-helix transcriptional regulator [Paenibacillus popilliae]GAC44072.1 predicted transcriptional regulator [Paenibacillus popilliae ATCC 14706]